MIRVNQLNHEPFFVNADLIERVLPGHETVLVLTTGRRIPVLEGVDEVVQAIRACHRCPRCEAEAVEQEVR